MRTLKLTIAYDGTAYAGWQFQPDRLSVQQTLETALKKVTGEQIRVLASGRTDAGVHALGQVVGFRTGSTLPPDVLRRALNANLPEDVAVLAVAEAPAGFHPTGSVVRKRYRYVIHDGPVRDVFARRYVWHYIHGRLDAPAMHCAAAALLGTHDFRSFESAGAERATSVRTIFDISVRRGRAGQGGDEGLEIRDWGLETGDSGNASRLRSRGEDVGCVERTTNLPSPVGRGVGGEGGPGALHAPYEPMIQRGRAGGQNSLPHAEREEYITIEVEADGFLYNMVRAMVGTLIEVGRGTRPETWPGEVLAAQNRRAAGPTAPPQGLFLVRVEY